MSDLSPELLTHAAYECRTFEEGKRVAAAIAQMCPRPASQLPGLLELIVNAIEHGNLQIDAETKAELIRTGRWLDELERRSKLPEFAQCSVKVSFDRTPSEIAITIQDAGAGFDHASFMNAEPDRQRGRGISIARTMSFDSIEYRGNGSEVCVRVRNVVNASARPTDDALAFGPGEAAATAAATKRPLILVADDEPVTRALLQAALREVYDVVMAVDGQDAIEKYQTQRPDLLLVDVQMPQLTGSQVCERIRSHETDARTPILLMSSQDDEASVLDGLGKGADAFIVKPFRQRVLLSKIQTHLAGKSTRDALAFQRERLLQLQRATAHEQFTAQTVLKNILGRGELGHPSIRCVMSGLSGFEGDVALVARLPDGGLRIMVSDVVGHGLPAALGTIPVSLLFYSTTRQGLELGAAMKAINRELCGVLPVGLFAAAAAFEVRRDDSTLRVWNGGIPDLVLRRHRQREIVRFASQNLPIGVATHDVAVVEEVKVATGDVLFAMSDGVVESRNAEGELFGMSRVAHVLSADRPLPGLFDDLRRELMRFGQGRQHDDITLLAHTIGVE